MKKKVILLLFCLLPFHFTFSQHNVFAFFEYDIKDGMDDQFINGYEKDLEWHKAQGDDWSWIGWFVMNGNRRGRFVDATPNHTWIDFDLWKVNSAENSLHNKIHWLPYVTNSSGSYKQVLDEFSAYDKQWFKSKFLQVYHVSIKNGEESSFRKFLSGYKSLLQDKLQGSSFVWMKTISGGGATEYQLFISLNNIERFTSLSNLFDFSNSEKELAQNYKTAIISNVSELWLYSEKLSLITDED